MSKKIIEMRNIRKFFYGVPALKNISFELEEGEVHALMGENGAGKSTLSKIIAGIYQADEGEMRIDGEKCRFANAGQANEKGIAMVTQEFSLMKDFSVAENIFLTNPGYYRAGFLSDKKAMIKKTEDLLQLFHMEKYIDPYMKVSELSVAQMQIVEIVKAMSKDAQILILDEPTASLTEREIGLLFDLIRDMKQKNISFIIVSHKINEIYEIADRITVLRDGNLILANAQTDTLEEGKLIQAMVGREVTNLYGRVEDKEKDFSKEPILMEVQNLCDTRNFVKNIDFKVHQGEIVGFSGLLGTGRTEMARCIFGADPRTGDSRVTINGTEVKPNCIRAAMNAGLGYVSEDRKHDGLFQELSISLNMNVEEMIEHRGVLTSQSEDYEACEIQRNALRIKLNSYDDPVKSLSGGNQQKVLLAKWLMPKPSVLIVDEPTRGVDIGAKADIYQILRELAGKGMGIVVISSEMPELIGLCNTIFIMREGQIRGELKASEVSEEKIGYYATIG